MSRVDEQFEEQRASNASGLPHFDAFRGHREQLTRLIEGSGVRAQGSGGERLCVLGAGNAYDLELEELLTRFAEVHLVDIDADAVGRARARVPEGPRARLFVHAPIDLSGMFQDIERYGRMQVTAQELMLAPAAGAKRIVAALPGAFDVVVSTCLLTQLQLSLLQLLGDRHQLFVALREFLTLTHLRTLAALTKPGGVALLVTDLCDAALFPAGRPASDADLPALMQELVAAGSVIHSSHPELIQITLGDDPVLARAFAASELSSPWLWQNGPGRRFLVYGMRLPRKPVSCADSAAG
jgi:SAM-dependent methyltransferase